MKPALKYCAVYTRKSTEEGLEQDFNSLDAQRESCLSYIASQKAEGWVPVLESYDDGFFRRYSRTPSFKAVNGGY
jgi:DNA invertase Pin-like site-specific DNA recombinase